MKEPCPGGPSLLYMAEVIFFYELTKCYDVYSEFFFSSPPGAEQIQGSFRYQVLQSESCCMEPKSIAKC